MKKYIAKFEAKGYDPNGVLKDYGMSVSDLDKMIEFLDKYGEEEEDEGDDEDEDPYFYGLQPAGPKKQPDFYNATPLKEELKKLKSGKYIGLRKWKVDNILSRYNEVKKLIDEEITLEDYLLELTDQHEITATIDPIKKLITIHLPLKEGDNVERVNLVTSFLAHLNKSKRARVDIEKITFGEYSAKGIRRHRSAGFKVPYSDVN